MTEFETLLQQPTNYILTGLPPVELSLILPSLELLNFEAREVLYEPYETLANVYFPDSGCVSIITKFRNESSVEAITVGREGMVGLPLYFGATKTHTQAICQIPGKVWCLPAHDFKLFLEKIPALKSALNAYAHTVFESLSQSTGCNRLHTIEERCARWLLMTHDRIADDRFQLTQEFLAAMLGVHRPGVSLVAKTLQMAGLIDYKHGKITILSRSGLEHISCECYSAVRHGTSFQNPGSAN